MTSDEQVIKVYATADGSIAPWTNPRRIHLHKVTPCGKVVCCASVTAGGIVKGRTNDVYWLTTHKFVPADKEECKLHADTSDHGCACVGHIKHTTEDLHFTIIAIHDTVAHSEVVAKSTDCYLSDLGPMAACLHYQAIRYQFNLADMALMARTRFDEVIHGALISIPEARIRPSYAPFPWQPRSSGLMMARFGGPSFPSRSQVEMGMWVYARRLESRGTDEATNKKLDAKEVGPYRPETFRYYPVEDGVEDGDNPNPLVLIGHVVEVQGKDVNLDGSVTVKIQGLYEVLERIVFFGF
ncbi:hypothetical protein GGR53DRAFT_468687 [Hypoxylon sp. FL1150]|nr:hypothetical protein GGR53DRAFT_468687 [Hypoxylon sp. FL1150]